MKHKVDIIEASAWINFLNSEASPNAEDKNLKIAHIGGAYMVALHTGVGLFVSPVRLEATDRTEEEIEEALTQAIAKCEQEYSEKKTLYKEAKGFLSF